MHPAFLSTCYEYQIHNDVTVRNCTRNIPKIHKPLHGFMNVSCFTLLHSIYISDQTVRLMIYSFLCQNRVRGIYQNTKPQVYDRALNARVSAFTKYKETTTTADIPKLLTTYHYPQ